MPRTLLVVDDSATMLKSLEGSLTMAGFQVITAHDGQEALRHLQGGLKPDLILTDIHMPTMDGIAFIHAARRLLRFTPILALTNASGPGKRQEAREGGATGWLKKPVGGNELVQVIEQLLGQPHG